jgi:hypothetical protein
MKIINESHRNNTISDIFVCFENEIESYSNLSPYNFHLRSYCVVIHVLDYLFTHHVYHMKASCHFLEFKICGYEGCGPLTRASPIQNPPLIIFYFSRFLPSSFPKIGLLWRFDAVYVIPRVWLVNKEFFFLFFKNLIDSLF